MLAHQAARQHHVLPGNADIAAPDLAVANQQPGDQLRRVDRGGKAKALGRQYHSRVDADHLAARVDERAAGIAWAERGVGLNDVVDQPP
jgi:hypothetical protein